jgi:hypothetical protein
MWNEIELVLPWLITAFMAGMAFTERSCRRDQEPLLRSVESLLSHPRILAILTGTDDEGGK